MKGSLSEKNILKLLWQLHTQEFHGLVLLSHELHESVLVFNNGMITFVASNQSQDQLEAMLIRKNKLDPAKMDELLTHRRELNLTFEETLLKYSAADPSTVLLWLKENHEERLGHILSWSQGQFETSPGSEAPHPSLPISLIDVLFDSRYASQTTAPSIKPDDTFFTSKSWKKYPPIHLFKQDIRHVLKLCEHGQKVKSLQELSKLSQESLLFILQRLFLFELLQSEKPEEELSLDELVGSALKAPSAKQPSSDFDIKDAIQQLTDIHLRLSGMNFFDLLKIEKSASTTEVRDAFLRLVDKVGPHRFPMDTHYDEKMRAEEILIKAAKALTTLTDPDLKVQYTDRLKKITQVKPGEAPGSMFKIQTKLLDANSQFDKGSQYLKKKNFKMAEEFFQYAFDVEPKNATFLTHLAWSKYLQHPDWTNQEVRSMLEKALTLEASNPIAIYHLGKFLIEKNSDAKYGLELLKKAATLDPKNIDIVRDLRILQTKVKT